MSSTLELVDAEVQPEDLAAGLADFVRAMGLLRPDRTPCGVAIGPSEAHAISVLAERGPLGQSELASRLGLDKSTVSRLVHQLEREGRILRRTDPADRRARKVMLSQKGARQAAQVRQARAEHTAVILDEIPADARAGVVDSLRLLAETARGVRERGRP